MMQPQCKITVIDQICVSYLWLYGMVIKLGLQLLLLVGNLKAPEICNIVCYFKDG